MNIIHKKREDIIKSNNIAQKQFNDLLETLDTSKISELNVSIILNGDLDLSVLQNDFKSLRTINFSKGNITSIRNIPKIINNLIISNNLLVEFENAPSDLFHLDIKNNYLEHLDISQAPDLETLDCQDNKLEEIKFPKKISITKLNIKNNDFKHLDLIEFPELLYLNISNNLTIVIESGELADNLREFENDNTPLSGLSLNTITKPDERVQQLDKQVDFITALNDYFKLKSQYEKNIKKEKDAYIKKGETIKEKKELLKKWKPSCIKCKKACGTIFANKDYRYIAICGSQSNPCSLNIKLYRGEHFKFETMLYNLKENLDDHKENIIKQKLDTLLNYISEQTSSKLFKEKMEEYNDDNLLYASTLKAYNDIFNNEENKQEIIKKLSKIEKIKTDMKVLLDEYKKTYNKQHITTVVNIYINDLLVEIEHLQRLKYDICEVDGNILYQNEIEITKKEGLYSEPPSVEKFIA